MEYPPLIKLLLLSTKQIKVIPFEIYLRETPKTWVFTQHGNVSFAQPMVFKMGMKAKSLIYYFSLLSSSQAGEIDGRIHLSIITRVAEVVRRYEGPSSKSLVSEESFSPNIRYFVAILKCCCYLCTLLKSLGNKRAFLVKNSVVWAKKCINVWYVLHITLC